MEKIRSRTRPGARRSDPVEKEKQLQRRSMHLGYASDTIGQTRRRTMWPTRERPEPLPISLNVEVEEDPEPTSPRPKARRNRLRSCDYGKAVARNRRNSEPMTLVPKARVAAYCVFERIALNKLIKWLDRKAATPRQTGDCNVWTNRMHLGVVHASVRPQSNSVEDPTARPNVEKQKDAFFFATGCCVFWGFTIDEENKNLKALRAYASARIADEDPEDMDYCYGDVSRIANDEITLGSTDASEMLAISFAMAQSIKLDVFEQRVEDRIQSTKDIPSSLAAAGSIPYSEKDISKLIGQLFIEIADVNLHSDILDEPDFFWENGTVEPIYAKMLQYLEVDMRVKILNKRLDMLRDLVEVLNQELSGQHDAKLEWIIIWLLAIGVVIDLGWDIIVKGLLGNFHHNK